MSKARLTVFDFERDTFFVANPRNVGGSRDFNKITSPNYPPDALETAMSGLETELSEGIKGCIKQSSFPGHDARNIILNFTALFAVRNPDSRMTRAEFIADLNKMVLDTILDNPDRYRETTRRMKESGYREEDFKASYEELKNFNESQEYTIGVSREYLLAQEFEVHDDVLRCLGARNWQFLLAADNAGTFITSDHPVMLLPSMSMQQGASLRPWMARAKALGHSARIGREALSL